MDTLYFTLRGLSPLLMHSPRGMKPGGKAAMDVKVILPPEEEAAEGRYLLPNGNFYVPAVAVRASLLNGAVGYRIGKRAAPRILAAAINLNEESFPLKRNGNPISGDDYSIDLRRAVIKRSGGVLRARAKIELPWELDCVFPFNSLIASVEHVTEALRNAGQVAGLLDFRPRCQGWFGKFEPVHIRVEKG